MDQYRHFQFEIVSARNFCIGKNTYAWHWLNFNRDSTGEVRRNKMDAITRTAVWIRWITQCTG